MDTLDDYINDLTERIEGCQGVVVSDKKGMCITSNYSNIKENDKVIIEEIDISSSGDLFEQMEKFGRGKNNSFTFNKNNDEYSGEKYDCLLKS